ncbi:hypothetical protein LTR35_000443 [Friedmanniomyces endolithicus]|nr:hypothetical protein LTS00_009285 [Friedmanniomyces endolithicus]KAK0293836.1 hypothetical protein LTR35_000443 [Friedmanniomyces endolithicus]KAK0991699.1 hypothetical protein LTR54_011619 [Friedmanniomyces endolithicus]KAK1072376.1 hypothetical protein LTR74_002689 [Friedmanniomyces endolithicus]
MSRPTLFSLALLACHVAAQTTSTCDPRHNASCPNDPALGSGIYNQTFTSTTTELNPNFWNVTSGNAETIQFGNNGAELVIAQSGDSVTAQSTFYIMYGVVEVIMQAAAGQGIISTFDLISDDLDEIDVEIMGGNTSYVESNWYGWGNTSQYNALYHKCDGPQQGLHNYTIVWTADKLQWIIDGTVARTLPYAKPGRYPQTPCMMKFGIWAGGDSKQPEGTIVWAGGKTDWTKGPFTMTVQSIKITDASTNTSSYSYGDNTGDQKSIKAVPGNSAAYNLINKKSAIQSAAATWNSLSTGAKIGIASGVGAVLAIIVVVYTIVCIKQRRRGRAEKAIADAQWNEHTSELMEYKTLMAKGHFAVSHMGHGEKF